MKEWLVRKAKKYYLGPFDRETIKKMILNLEITAYDEISQSMHPWMHVRDCPAFMQWVEKMAPHGSEEKTVRLTDEEVTHVTLPGKISTPSKLPPKIIDLKPKPQPAVSQKWISKRWVAFGGVGVVFFIALWWWLYLPTPKDAPLAPIGKIEDPKLKELSETFRQYHVYLYQGELEEKAGNVKEAIALYQKAMQSNGNDFKAEIRLTALEMAQGRDPNQVRLNFLKILSKPDLHMQEVAEIHNYLGLLELKLQKYEAAKGYFEKSIKTQQNFAPAHFNLGYAYFFLKQYYNARRQFEQAVERQPHLPIIYLYLGRTLQTLGKHEQAIREYENANRINPNLHLPYLYLSFVYFRLGKIERSIDYLKQMIRKDPDYVKNTYQDTQYFQESISYDFILKTYAVILKEKKQDTTVLAGLGLLYFLDGQKQKGMLLAKNAIGQNEADPTAHMLYGYMLAAQGNLEPALKHLNTSLRYAYQNSFTHVMISEIYYRLGQYQRAIEHCRKIFGFDPYYVRAYEVLGRSLVQLDRVSEAVKAFTKALEYDPNYIPAKKMLLKYSQ